MNGPVGIEQPKAAFHVDRLTIKYDDGQGAAYAPLKDFSIKIREGEVTCLLGPSGCGKTTLLKALGGFVIGESTGGVLFDGQFQQGPTPEIVMIFQENNLFPWLNVRSNVAFGLKFMPKEKVRPGVLDEMLEAVGLQEAATRYPHQLSGGMRQRTAIARALITDPRVLLLDEPFSALDVSLRRRMQQLLRDLWEKTGMTMVMVTHSIEEALYVGHRVIVFGGRPADVVIDTNTRDPALRDRYSEAYLQLQRRIESVIY